MDPVKTGSFISLLRREKGYTQKELAQKLNVSDKAISRWETGKGFPDTALLKPLSDTLGISVGELLAGERFCREEVKEKTDQVLVSALKLTKRERAVLYGLCAAMAVVCLVLLALPWLLRPATKDFVNSSQTRMIYKLGQVYEAGMAENAGFRMHELSEGYEVFDPNGTERYVFWNAPEGPVMSYMHCSGEGELFGFEIGENTVIKANSALGVRSGSLRDYLKENGFRDRHDLMMEGNPFGRPTLVYINGERCNWYPYTKDNVFINICISAYEGNRLMAYDIGLLGDDTEQFCAELQSGFSLILEDPYGLVTGEMKQTYQQWEQITITARRDVYKTLYVYINGQLMGKCSGPDPYHPDENTYAFEMWGAPVTVRITPDAPEA